MSNVLIIKGADFTRNALDTVELDIVHCTGISLNKSTLAVNEIGYMEALVPTVLPSNCEESVIWRSSNTDCCAVRSDGVVTVVGVGTSTITAKCGGYSATCAVTVEIPALTVVRIKQAEVSPATSTNNYTNFSAFPVTETNWGLTRMAMFKYQQESNELIVGYSLVTYENNIATLPTWDEATNAYVTRCKNAGMTGYPAPIPLPAGCTKVRTFTPLEGYGSRVLWFKTGVRSGDGTSDENRRRGYFVAYRDPAPTNNSYEWNYNSGETFDVPEGYDSCAVVWDSGNEAVNFHTMTYDDVAKFQLYFS